MHCLEVIVKRNEEAAERARVARAALRRKLRRELVLAEAVAENDEWLSLGG